MRFSTKELNQMSAEQIKAYQEKKLRHQLAYCYENSEYYHKKFQDCGATPEDIKTLEDFRKLPIMMTKQDERESQRESLERFGHPFGMHLCAPLDTLELTFVASLDHTGGLDFDFIAVEEDGAILGIYKSRFIVRVRVGSDEREILFPR